MPDALTLPERVALAIAACERQSGLDRSLDDVIAPLTDRSYSAAVGEVENILGVLWEAANDLIQRHSDGTQASPLISALLLPNNVDPGMADVDLAEGVIEAIRLISSLPLSAYAEANARSKRGRRPTRSIEVRAAVRAAVHHLHLRGEPKSGGWIYPDREKGRGAKRTTDEELIAVGAAGIVVAAVKAAGLVASHAEIRGHHLDYIAELGGRPPTLADYVPDYFAMTARD